MPTVEDPQDIIKIDTDLVPLDVIATDPKGRLVRNLHKEDFRLFEDGVEARDLVRQKDMLFALEKGVDRCEDAMDVIRSVVVKNG